MIDKRPSGTQCASCGLFFSSVSAFDRHRTGPHAVTKPHPDGQHRYFSSSERRCMNASEMLASGLVLHNDVWRFSTDEQAKLYFQKLKEAVQ